MGRSAPGGKVRKLEGYEVQKVRIHGRPPNREGRIHS
jgi:hypothetical protein